MPPAEKRTEAKSGAQPGNYAEPFRNYNFKLCFTPDVPEGHFTEFSGIRVDIPPIMVREGGLQQVIHQLPGHPVYAPVTLRGGLTQSRDLWDWMLKAASGNVERRTVAIALLAPDGIEEKVCWTLHDAWPCSWQTPRLDAMSNMIAIETLELAYETLERG
jgi:phage tail-like protein